MTEQATPTLTLTEFKSTRETRRAELLVEYRELVKALAQDDSMQSTSGQRLDDIMARLKIGDDDLATDIEDTKQHRQLSQSIAEFQAKQPQIDKQHAKWTKVIAKVRKEMEEIERRMNEAQQERILAGQPHNRDRGEKIRKQELESRNTRMFGPPENA